MSRIPSHPLLTLDEHHHQEKEEERTELDYAETEADAETDVIEERFKCLSLHKRDFIRRGGNLYNQWKQEQRIRASRMELHLSERWALDELIEEQLSRFDAHYSRALGCLHSEFKKIHRVITQAQKLRTLDEHHHQEKEEERTELDYAETEADAETDVIEERFKCLSLHKRDFIRRGGNLYNQWKQEQRIRASRMELHLSERWALDELIEEQLSRFDAHYSRALGCLHSEFKKIHRVITQAQKLRFKTLELIVKKLLSRTQAAKFLVAFAGIQDMVHDFAACQKRLKGPVSVTIKPLGT